MIRHLSVIACNEHFSLMRASAARQRDRFNPVLADSQFQVEYLGELRIYNAENVYFLFLEMLIAMKTIGDKPYLLVPLLILIVIFLPYESLCINFWPIQLYEGAFFIFPLKIFCLFLSFVSHITGR